MQRNRYLNGRAAAVLAAVLAGALTTVPTAAANDDPRVVRVTHAELLQAMRPEQGYDAATTTNSGRFQGNVYLRLARMALERGDTDVLFIHHLDWYDAFMEYAVLDDDEVPDFLRLMREYEQDALIDIRPDAVIARVRRGRAPELAVSVRLAFANPTIADESFSYEDQNSDPTVRVRNDSVVTFFLMDMGDEIYMDEIRGSKARPMSGSLGALFAVIGTAEIRSVRMAIAEDGTAVSIARAKAALITVPASITTSPWGRAERGIEASRDDLRAIEDRLKQPLEFDYVEADWEPIARLGRLAAGEAPRMEVEFIGNMALRLESGDDVLYTDFPYRSGAHGYMEYPGEIVDEARHGVALITHEHADHWSAELFERTGLQLIAAPAIAAEVDQARVVPWSEVIEHGGLTVHPIRSDHTDDHYSYLVEWATRRLYFTGDTEDPTALLAQRDLDVVFVSPWLLRVVQARGAAIDAPLVVVYHHTEDEEIPAGAAIHVPSRNSRFIIP